MANLSTMPARLDLQAYGGDDTNIILKFKDANGAYFIPAGTLTAQARASVEDTTAYDLTVTKDTGTTSVKITIPGTVSSPLALASEVTTIYVANDQVTAPVWFGVWDLQESNTETRTLCFGSVAFVGEVTR